MVDLKDPEAILTYGVDWRGMGYLQTGEAIASASWSVAPVETGGLVIDSGTQTVTGDVTSCRVSGGIVGHVYLLTCRITYTGGNSDDRSWTIRIGSQ